MFAFPIGLGAPPFLPGTPILVHPNGVEEQGPMHPGIDEIVVDVAKHLFHTSPLGATIRISQKVYPSWEGRCIDWLLQKQERDWQVYIVLYGTERSPKPYHFCAAELVERVVDDWRNDRECEINPFCIMQSELMIHSVWKK